MSLATRLRRTHTAAFSPADIPGLRYWYDANTLALANNDPVSTWADLSGNSLDLTGTTTTRPLWKTAQVNGFPAVDFDGSDDFLSRASMSISPTTGQWTSFAVARLDSVSGVHSIVDADLAASRIAQILRTNGTAAEALQIAGGVATDVAGVTLSTATWYVFEAVHSATTIECLVNGATNGTTASTGLSTATTTFALGANGSAGAAGGAARLDGQITAAIGYDNAVSSPNRSLARAYLGSRYGITVS